MPCIIHRVNAAEDESVIMVAQDTWDLGDQVYALELWLKNNHETLDSAFAWIADIGFSPRKNASGGGPAMTKSLMKMCIDANMEIFLSEYPASA